MLAMAAPAAVNACSSNGDAVSSGQDGGMDATGGDAQSTDSNAPDGGAAGDADAKAPGDAGADAVLDGGPCAPSAPYYADAGPDDSGVRVCYYYEDLPCGATFPQNNCYLLLTDCQKVCAKGFFDCHYTSTSCDEGGVFAPPDAAVTVACGTCAAVGRRPAGLANAHFERAESALGDYFTRVAHLEAASVDAFIALRDELIAHGAPDALSSLANRSARDEVRHARVTARLARRHGGDTHAPRVAPRRRRTLEAMARENAVEGCVRETFGAMLATWQAAHAEDPEIKAAMERIARDETRHAALAWAIARWAEGRLDEAARTRISRAKRRAIARLEREIRAQPDATLVSRAGVPDRRRAKTLLSGMTQTVWA